MDLLAKNVNVNLLCVMFLNVHVFMLNSMVMFKNNQTTWPYLKKNEDIKTLLTFSDESCFPAKVTSML